MSEEKCSSSTDEEREPAKINQNIIIAKLKVKYPKSGIGENKSQ